MIKLTLATGAAARGRRWKRRSRSWSRNWSRSCLPGGQPQLSTLLEFYNWLIEAQTNMPRPLASVEPAPLPHAVSLCLNPTTSSLCLFYILWPKKKNCRFFWGELARAVILLDMHTLHASECIGYALLLGKSNSVKCSHSYV